MYRSVGIYARVEARWHNSAMVMVVDKKVVKHVVQTGDGLLEIPVRIKFEYEVQSARFVDGSMSREYLFNRQAVIKHFPRLDPDALDREIENVVDRCLEEHLRYARQVEGDIRLYEDPRGADTEDEAPTPRIIMPDE
ncbi:MAG: hypothetical protein HUJ31_16710 [Pseudomonadales bacterium]|nr:hypothetical protein [Pseudomonadales bacterium]